MPASDAAFRDETDSLLENMTPEKREYLLWRLASEKLADQKSNEPIPVRRPDDGTLVGYLRRPAPPSQEDRALMLDRAKRTDPSKGKDMHELLHAMRAGDVEAVQKFIR
jgi:hypothetical protein